MTTEVPGTPEPMVPAVEHELAGWKLFWRDLELAVPDADAGIILASEVERARDVWQVDTLAQQPVVAALRGLFRAAGCDPTRYRPSSEALLRRVLKGSELPSIHPFVDLNNCLSLRLGVPACVMAEGSFEAPFVLRAGREGESYESLKGPFNLAGKPLLADALGPCDAPITGSRRVMIRPDSRRATLVAYLPAGVVSKEQAGDSLRDLLRQVEGIRAA